MPSDDPETKPKFDWQKLLPILATAILSGGGASVFSNSQSSALEAQTKLEAKRLEDRTQERIQLLERQTFQLVTLWNMTQNNKVNDVLGELPMPDKYQ